MEGEIIRFYVMSTNLHRENRREKQLIGGINSMKKIYPNLCIAITQNMPKVNLFLCCHKIYPFENGYQVIFFRSLILTIFFHY